MTAQTLEAEIQSEIQAHKICVYTKGTKEMPRCGFTMGIKEFFEKFGYPFTFIDVLDNHEKREVLTQLTNWPTLPKVFINGKFYGDDDILSEMVETGELEQIFKETFES